MMKLAALLRKGRYRLFSWWPSLLQKAQDENEVIVPYPMPDLDMLVRTFLNHIHRNDKPKTDLRTKGINMVQLYDAHWRFDKRFDEDFLLVGVVYLMASFPGFLIRMMEWMKTQGYDFGEFDK